MKKDYRLSLVRRTVDQMQYKQVVFMLSLGKREEAIRAALKISNASVRDAAQTRIGIGRVKSDPGDDAWVS